ncbi:RNA polymerase sigma factor [Reichenbachiella versicolor]|uniref:RNA polymerase sigma factor n=1 Tax=Reichenbachiella versicolor TaxID=1821036 RepID=UPI000D6E1932|nr:RNA polymerase sigma-70 factor [Reichenbachiella versicolor]
MSSSTLDNSSDIELMKLVKSGNQLAFDQLYNKYWNLLFSIAYQKTGSQCDAEDLVHEVFLDIWKGREKIEIKSSFAAYIATSLKYKIFRQIESKSVKQRYQQHVVSSREETELNTQNYLAFNELYDLIEESVDGLPDKCKSVFKLSREQDYSIKEIAEELEISPNTAKNHIKYALKQLRVDLYDYLTVVLILNVIHPN